MVLGLRPSTRTINEISVGAIKSMPSTENSVGARNKNSVGAIKENSVGARSAPLILRCVRSNVIIITVDRVGELKDLMIDASRPYVSVLCSTVNRKESDAQTHLLLGSILIFYFNRYYGSVSCFLF